MGGTVRKCRLSGNRAMCLIRFGSEALWWRLFPFYSQPDFSPNIGSVTSCSSRDFQTPLFCHFSWGTQFSLVCELQAASSLVRSAVFLEPIWPRTVSVVGLDH